MQIQATAVAGPGPAPVVVFFHAQGHKKNRALQPCPHHHPSRNWYTQKKNEMSEALSHINPGQSKGVGQSTLVLISLAGRSCCSCHHDRNAPPLLGASPGRRRPGLGRLYHQQASEALRPTASGPTVASLDGRSDVRARAPPRTHADCKPLVLASMMMHSPQCARPFPKPRAQQDQGVIALSAPLQEPSATPFMPFSSGDEADLYAQSSAASSYGELEDMMPIDIVDPVMSFTKLDHRADEQDKPCRHAWGADTGPSPLPQLGSSSWDNDAAFVTTSSDEIEDTMPVAKEVDVHDFLHCSHEWDMETFGASPKRTLPSFLHNPKGDQQARPTKRYKSFLLTDTRVLPISDSTSQKPDQKPGQPFDAADKKPKTRENGVKDTEPVLSLGNGRRRERKPPNRLMVNAWNDQEPDTAKKARARSKLACPVASSFARKGVSDGKTKIEGTKSCNSSKLFATSSMKTKEDEVSQRYLDRGYKVTLCNQTSVVNKKVIVSA